MLGGLKQLAIDTAARDAAWPVMPVVAADMLSGEILCCTTFAAGIFGYTPDELIGKPVEILLPEDLRASHALWRKDASVPKTRLMGVGRQIRGRRKDGSFIPVHVGLTATKIMDLMVGVAFVIDLTGIVLPVSNPSIAHPITEGKPHARNN